MCRLAGRPEFVEKLIVTGGTPLQGEISIQGSKNAVLPILAACLLGEGPCELENCPEIKDVEDTLHILRKLGCQVNQSGKTVRIDAETAAGYEIIGGEAARIRSSVLFLGALLGKMRKAVLPKPGGCAIGKRPIDLHLAALERLGAAFSCEGEAITAEGSRLHCGTIRLGLPSVGATENSILAAVLLPGETRIEHAAQEPEIVDLANFLNRMGARIKGAGTDTIKIEGVEKLHGVTHSVIPDRIEAGTFMVASVITGGNILIRNVVPDHVKAITAKLKECGAEIYMEEEGMVVRGDVNPIVSTDVKTLPYPGFPTDLQSPFMALLAVSKGPSVVIETVFENRFMHVSEFNRMGANIKTEGNCAIIPGGKQLQGAQGVATDLRAGAAVILTGLVAEGTTEVSDIYHIDRGYEKFVDKFRGLGATIIRIED